MSDRPTDGGEYQPGETYVAHSGRCRIKATCQLLCVEPPPNSLAYILVTFEAGEEHVYDRLQWKNKDGTPGGGFVVRTGDGDAHLMGYLFERACEVIGERPRVKAVEVKAEPVVEPAPAPVPVVVAVAQPPQKKPIRVKKVAKREEPTKPSLFDRDGANEDTA